MKRILILVMSLVLLGGMVFAAAESAQVIITTSVGETTANSGIRVVESYTGITTTEFDTAFFSASSVLPLATVVDTSTTATAGGFVVMVRRPTSTTVTVSVSGTPMALVGGTGIVPTIPYMISATEDAVSVDYISSGTALITSYEANTVVDGILRDAKAFTYNIPVSASAPLGTYSATVTFTITVG
jgi:hypothetical protein